MGEPETIHEYLRQHPALATSYRPSSLADLAEKASSREDFLFRVRQFLDDFRRPQSPESQAGLVEQRPPPAKDPRWDAFLGALAEHLASHAGLMVPSWSHESPRFLRSFWFVHQPAYDALALVQSPAAFRRRGVFITGDFLSRV